MTDEPDPTWLTLPPVEPANTPAIAPAYGESQPVIAPAQPAIASAPPPAGPGTPGSGGTTAALNLQFIVTIDGSGVATVAANSKLQQSYTDTDFLAITGLGGGRSTSTTDKFWLEVDVDASVSPYTFSNAAIKSLGAGDSFGGGVVENDGGVGSPPVYSQVKMRMVIATSASGVVNQKVNSQLRIDQFIAFLHTFDSSDGSDQPLLGAYAYST